jgi:glycosyltransferase involved in cell wall biosynthesis
MRSGAACPAAVKDEARGMTVPSSPPLRILQVFEPPDGGLPTHVADLTVALVRRGHHVIVAGAAGSPFRERIEGAGVVFEPLPLVRGIGSPRTEAHAVREMWRLLDRTPCDVVHVHGQKAGLSGRVVALARSRPVVYTPHGLHYHTQLRRPRPSARLRFRATLAAERWLCRRSAAVVAVSRDEQETVLRDRLIAAERCHLIYNGVGVDTSRAPDPRLCAFRAGAPLVGFVGRLGWEKGILVLLDALELLARRGTPVRCAIVGNGPLFAQVRQRVGEAPLSETTLLLPYEGGMEPYLRAIDALVLPSFYEGMPLAILAAMALGVPAIASRVNGVPEAIEDRCTGLLVPAGDVESLATVLARANADPRMLSSMGAAARHASRRFGVETMVDAVERLYRSVLAHPTGARPGGVSPAPPPGALSDQEAVSACRRDQ